MLTSLTALSTTVTTFSTRRRAQNALAASGSLVSMGKRQNSLTDEHIEKIVDTYKPRLESVERYARRVEMHEIEANDFNLNISRYVSTAEPKAAIDLSATHTELIDIETEIRESTAKHNTFLKELGLSPLPAPD